MNGVTLLSKIPVPSLEHTVLRFLFRGHAWNGDGISYAGMTYSTGLPNFLGRLLHSPISRTYFAAFGCVSFIYCSYLGNVHTFSRGHIIWRYDAHECFSSEPHRSRDGTRCFWRIRVLEDWEGRADFAMSNTQCYYFTYNLCSILQCAINQTSVTEFGPVLLSWRLSALHVVIWIETNVHGD